LGPTRPAGPPQRLFVSGIFAKLEERSFEVPAQLRRYESREVLPQVNAPPRVRDPSARAPSPSVAGSTDLRTVERRAIERTLMDARHNKSLAAKNLGLSRKQLYARLRHHGLD
jgi:transcriptional regulator with PAS, ATPase and Fis domain